MRISSAGYSAQNIQRWIFCGQITIVRGWFHPRTRTLRQGLTLGQGGIAKFSPWTGGNREIFLSAFLITFYRPRGGSSEGCSNPGLRPFVPRTIKKKKR